MNKTVKPNYLNAQQNKANCKSLNQKDCNLTFKTPELYDSKVLSFTDYLKVFSLQLLFTYFEMLILSKEEKSQLQKMVNNLINNIRKKPRHLDLFVSTNICNTFIKKV